MSLSPTIAYTDGGVRPYNPGNTGIGVFFPDKRIKVSLATGYGTNNDAEYEAVIAALLIGSKLGIRHIEIRSDSELIVRQVNGTYQPKKPNLIFYRNIVLNLSAKFDTFSINWVPRTQNHQADALATKGLNSPVKQPKPSMVHMLNLPIYLTDSIKND